jgi:3-hydroxyisobutyrate dehydrogenase-like beta-hydroxyacid dehydrogenase
MPPLIAIIGTGAMGSAVAQRLVAHGCRVITELEGRSAASRQRARDAGMTAATRDQLATADFVLSIVPPAVATLVAEQLAPLLAAAARKAVYVDCNAVSPKTVGAIAAVIAPTGWAFADAGIIGLPPSEPGHTVFYASGAAARRCAALGEYGLDVRVLDGPVGAASALKMSYAGMTKGVTAICTAMLLAASRAGAADALRAELSDSRPELLDWSRRNVPRMFPKAYRWVAEMEEIAEFAADDPATQQIYRGIARLYERLARDVAGPHADADTLAAFLALAR